MTMSTDQLKVFLSVQSSVVAAWMNSNVYSRIAQLLPRDLHPNWITLATLLMTLGDVMVMIHCNYNLDNPHALPWLYLSLSGLMQYVTDCLDGSHARRTKQTSRFGELFDHSVDAVRYGLAQPLCIIAAAGVYGLSPKAMVAVWLTYQIPYSVILYVHRATGVFYYPCAEDLLHYVIAGFYFKFWMAGIPTRGSLRIFQKRGEELQIMIYASAYCLFIPQQLWILWRAERTKHCKSFITQLMLMPTLAWAWQHVSEYYEIMNAPLVTLLFLGLCFVDLQLHIMMEKPVTVSWNLPLILLLCLNGHLVILRPLLLLHFVFVIALGITLNTFVGLLVHVKD